MIVAVWVIGVVLPSVRQNQQQTGDGLVRNNVAGPHLGYAFSMGRNDHDGGRNGHSHVVTHCVPAHAKTLGGGGRAYLNRYLQVSSLRVQPEPVAAEIGEHTGYPKGGLEKG